MSFSNIIANRISFVYQWLVCFLIFVMTCCTFIPFHPGMPQFGFDPSWIFGVNQALAQGLHFGRDIIFTYGPYAAVVTHLYQPETFLLMLSCCVYVTFCYSVNLSLFAMSVPRYAGLLLLPLLFSQTIDVLFFVYGLLLVLNSVQFLYAPSLVRFSPRVHGLLLIVLLSPLGLLALIKTTYFMLSGILVFLCAGFFITHARRGLGAIALVVPLCSLLLFWKMAHQSFRDIPPFVWYATSIARGYMEGMALVPINFKQACLEIGVYLIAASMLLIALFLNKKQPKAIRVVVGLAAALVLFVAFKESFVRHDAHALHGMDALFFCTFLLLPFLSGFIAPLLVVGCAIVAYLAIGHGYPNQINVRSKAFVQGHVQQHLFSWEHSEVWSGAGRAQLTREFHETLQRMHQANLLPTWQGTADLYSYQQAHLLSSGNVWSPRFAFQSDSAYTPDLIKRNQQHLLEASAPDHIIFSITPVDDHLPSLEDAASWPILLHRYTPTLLRLLQRDIMNDPHNEILVLAKRHVAGPIPTALLVQSGSYKLGKAISLSAMPPQMLFVKMDFKPTFFGRMASLLLKSSPLELTVAFRDGSTRTYRLISGIASSGFFLSPFIENTKEFSLLYEGPKKLEQKRVYSFSVSTTALGKKLHLWHRGYQVKFYTLKPSQHINHIPSEIH